MDRCSKCTFEGRTDVCPLIVAPLYKCGWRGDEYERRKKLKLYVDPNTGLRRKYIFQNKNDEVCDEHQTDPDERRDGARPAGRA